MVVNRTTTSRDQTPSRLYPFRNRRFAEGLFCHNRLSSLQGGGERMPQEPQRSLGVLDLARWLAGPARIGLTPVEIVAGCCQRLRAGGGAVHFGRGLDGVAAGLDRAPGA